MSKQTNKGTNLSLYERYFNHGKVVNKRDDINLRRGLKTLYYVGSFCFGLLCVLVLSIVLGHIVIPPIFMLMLATIELYIWTLYILHKKKD